MSGDAPGQVITFYSYKGGTGRSMALSNIACLLAQRQSLSEGKGVLIIDWDLEAPGLHRFFHNKFKNSLGGKVSQYAFARKSDATALSYVPSREYEQKLELHPGLIDLFEKLDERTRQSQSRSTETTGDSNQELQDEEAAYAAIEAVNPEQFILMTDVPSLYMMKAGCFNNRYAERVSKFQWEALYNRSPWLIRSLAEYLAERYRYVIIDSRTGITDISGICTMLLPEKLVVVFTPNRQSLLGVQELVRRATKYRRQSDDLRPLIVFPLPSRIEATEPRLRDSWRLGDEGNDIPGYQPLFERLFEEVYDLPVCNLTNYFDEVQIQHAPSYAYGENVAVLIEQSGGRLSLPHSYEMFVEWVDNRPVPWEQPQATSSAQEVASDQVKLAEATYARLTVEQQEATRKLFTRLVRLARPEEGGEDTRQRIKLSELFPAEQEVVREWEKARLVLIRQEESGSNGKAGSDITVEPVSESLIREWKRLRTWLDADKEFLLWRQSLRSSLVTWESTGRQQKALLVGLPLAEAKERRKVHEGVLSDAEKTFIDESIAQGVRRQRRTTRITIAAVLALLLIFLSFIFYSQYSNQKKQQEKNNTQNAFSHLTKGQAYMAAEEYDKAIKEYDEAIQLKPDFAEAFYERGRSYDSKKDRNHAISDYDQAIKLKNDYAEAYLKRGDVYYAQSSPDRALSDYNQVISLQPDNADGYYSRGVVYVDQSNFSSAIADFNKALEISPNHYAAMYQRGYARMKSGDRQGAISDLQAAYDQTIDPEASRNADALLREMKVARPMATPSIIPPTGSRLAYCNDTNVFVRSAPDLSARPLTKITKGQKLWVIGKSSNLSTWNGVTSDWTQVQLYNDSMRGWVFSPFISY